MRWLFDLAWVALLTFVAASSSMLPEMVTEGHGRVMARASFTALMLGTVIAVPWLCTRGIALMARRWPALVHFPNKDYWLAPERREASIDWLGRHSFSFGLLIVMRLAVLQWQVMQWNLPAWPHWAGLPLTLNALAQGVFLVGLLLWTVTLRRRFWRAG